MQGEVAGPGINKNTFGLKELDVFMFNLWSIDKGEYLPFEVLDILCNKTGLNAVPLGRYGISLENETMDSMIEMARGKYANGKQREGIVVRPIKEMRSSILGGRLSFKVCNNDYLLKSGE